MSHWKIAERYDIEFTGVDKTSTPVQGANVLMTDKDGTDQFTGTTNEYGVITPANVLDREWWFDPEDPTRNTTTQIVEYSYNPYTTKVRCYGYMPQEFSTTVNGIQKINNMLLANPSVVATQAVANAYTGISVDGVTNTITISEDHTMQEVYDYCEDWYSLTPNMMKNEPFETTDGQNFFSTYDLILDGSHLTGTGRINIVVNTVTYLNNATSTLDIVAVDGTHTNIKLTNLTAGSLIELYDIGTSTRLYCEYNAGTTFTYPIIWTVNRDIGIYVSYVNGVTAKEFWKTTATLENNGISLRVEQIDDEMYNGMLIDGSLVDEYIIDNGVLLLQINDGDGKSTPQRAYAYNVYWLFTKTGIADHQMYTQADSLVQIKLLSDILISNLSGIPVGFYNGLFVDKDGSADPWDIYDMASDPMFSAYGQAIGLPYTSNPQSPDILVAYTLGDD